MHKHLIHEGVHCVAHFLNEEGKVLSHIVYFEDLIQNKIKYMLQKMDFVTFLSLTFLPCYLCSLLIRIYRIKIIDNHKYTTNRRFTLNGYVHIYVDFCSSFPLFLCLLCLLKFITYFDNLCYLYSAIIWIAWIKYYLI